MDYLTVANATLPVYLTMAAGAAARRFKILADNLDVGLMRLAVSLLTPCLIIERILGNPALMDGKQVLISALLGFALVALSIFISYFAAPLIGLKQGEGRRTFGISCGLQNYGYVAIPMVEALFPAGTVGVLFTFTLGVEIALWTVAVGVLTGMSKAPWKLLLNAPVIAIVIALLGNAFGLHAYVPKILHTVMGNLGSCAIPLCVLLIGASIYDLWGREPINWKVAITSPVLRMALLPMLFIGAGMVLPLSIDMKRILVVQAGMPSAVFAIVLARHYGGHAATAVQVVLATTVVSLASTPLMIAFGMKMLGLAGSQP
jgi:malate permease and related proteins